MGPAALAQVLRPLAGMFAPDAFPALLRGLDPPDDAAVWKLDAERAIVLTSDFFPPVVDDPHDFGAIAAANALSDLYAMGAEALMAINLVGWPEELDPEILAEVLRGGGEKVREAGGAIAGGHTTTDREPKYGLAALGTVHPDRVFGKGGARAGDVLVLGKPLGTGAITTAHKKGEVESSDLAAAVASMSRLNRAAARLLREAGDAVHAVTDITGFGLVGHAHEMAEQSGLALRFRWEALPQLPGAEGYLARGFVPGGGRRNHEHYGPWVELRRPLPEGAQALPFDPQTSGGLLAAVSAERAGALEAEFRRADEPLWRVGEAVAGRAGAVEIV